MKRYPVNEVQADFSKLFDRALAGVPSRVTQDGKGTVVIVSEEAWKARTHTAPTLGHLLARYAEAGLLGDDVTNRPWNFN